MSDVEEAIKSKWLQCPFPNGLPNEAFLTSGECYSPTIIPILFIWNGASIFISHLLRSHLYRWAPILLEITFNLAPRSHAVSLLLLCRSAGTIESTRESVGQTASAVIGIDD